MVSMSINLPSDLLKEILARLPVKSLLRFRCVSKEWHSFISNSEFTHLHFNRYKQKKRSLFVVTSGVQSISYALVENNNHPCLRPSNFINLWNCDYKGQVKSLSSCNGLICFVFSCGDEPLYLLNPATQELKKLPPPNREIPRLTSSHEVAVWFDPTNRDYKVVLLYPFVTGDSSCIAMFVYSMNSNEWREVENVSFPGKIVSGRPIINGSLHWMNKSGNIYSFDLTHEVFRELSSTSEEEEEYSYLDLFDMQGTLYLVRSLKTHGIEFWRMEEYGVGESWTLVGFSSLTFPLISLGLWNDDEILLQPLLQNEKLVLHNTRNITTRIFPISGLPAAPNFKAITLNESLVKLRL